MTTIHSWKNKIYTFSFITFSFFLAAATVGASENLDFAEHLFFDGDYYRAIGEYKRERFFGIDPETDFFCSTRIISALRLSQKYEDSLSELYRLGDVELYDSSAKEWILTNFALNYYGLRLLPNAIPFLETAIGINAENPRTLLYRGLFAAEEGRWPLADEYFSHAAAAGKTAADLPAVKTSEFALDSVQGHYSIKKKLPALAGGLSALFPGLGQLYGGHWFDAMQAVTLVGIFGLATHAAYLYEDQQNNPFIYTGILAGVTFSLHFSNIFGAYKTAEYHNKKQEEDILHPLRTRILELSVPDTRNTQ